MSNNAEKPKETNFEKKLNKFGNIGLFGGLSVGLVYLLFVNGQLNTQEKQFAQTKKELYEIITKINNPNISNKQKTELTGELNQIKNELNFLSTNSKNYYLTTRIGEVLKLEKETENKLK